MKIVRVLLLRFFLTSTLFLIIGISIFSMAFSYQLATKLHGMTQAELKGIADAAANQYAFGNIVTLKSDLSAAAARQDWLYASFWDSNSTKIWEHSEAPRTPEGLTFSGFLWKASLLFLGDSFEDNFVVKVAEPITVTNNFSAGTLVVTKSIRENWEQSLGALRLTIFILFFFWLSYFISNWVSTWALLKPLNLLSSAISQEASSLGLNVKKSEDLDEITQIRSWFSIVAHSWKEASAKALEAERVETSMKVARQVAHDIRSPILALDVAVKDANELPEERRVMVRAAITRIRDIANNLLKHPDARAAEKPRALEPELMSFLIETILSEKRTQHKSIHVFLSSYYTRSAEFCFCKVDAEKFRRALSNILENAVEASHDEGTIHVVAATLNDQLVLKITDQGKGIPPEVLERIGKGPVTFGKAEGNGLGLQDAFKQIQSFGGTIQVRSELGKGTEVEITLPITKNPHWFASEVVLKGVENIVIVDDDQSVHNVWRHRLSLESPAEGTVRRLHHFYDPDEFRAWYDQSPAEESFFLVDFEFLNHKNNGLDLIEELNLGPKSMLVTSHFDNRSLRERAVSLKVKILPKSFSSRVEINAD